MSDDKQCRESAPFQYSRDFVRPLHEAENEFLQVLLTKFRIRNKGRGLELSVDFDYDTPAIWLRRAKTHLLEHLSAERRADYQSRFEKLLAQEDIHYTYSDEVFPFRFGNGGTLPVVRVGQTDYYCLFFRDAHPMGWNIANGGANDLHDLLHPDAIIERELREELIIVEPERGRRYVFDWHDARLKDHPDFALANCLWMERFRRQNFPEFTEIPLPLKWLPPTDVDPRADTIRTYDSVRVRFEDDPPMHTGCGLLNITGEDFGIEFDRVAKLAVGPDAIFCDGEIVHDRLLNRVVGLFEVESLNAALVSGSLEFLPDRLYWNGQDRTDDDPVAVIGEYLSASRQDRQGTEDSDATRHDKIALGLCPVTKNLISRFLRLIQPAEFSAASEGGGQFDVFLSFGSEDRQLARQVFRHLVEDGRRRVFFSDVTLNHGPFSQQIDWALDTSQALVAVGSRLEYLHKSWVRYEWESFHNDILSGRKPSDTPFVAFVTGVDLHDLPRPFRHRQAVQSEPTKLDEAMKRLAVLIQRP